MLGPVVLPTHLFVEWVIIGQMSGPKATKADPSWVESLTKQARREGVPVFHKDNLGALATVKSWPVL
jgi:protein gp37